MNAIWKQIDAACFGPARRDPEPQVTRHDAACAEQFADDLESIVTDLASEVSRWSEKLRDGERAGVGLTLGEREEMLTELMRWAAVAKQMRKGEV